MYMIVWKYWKTILLHKGTTCTWKFNMKYATLMFLGPVERTMPGVWRMIWEQKVPCIVMVTNFTEASTLKVQLLLTTVISRVIALCRRVHLSYRYTAYVLHVHVLSQGALALEITVTAYVLVKFTQTHSLHKTCLGTCTWTSTILQ